MIYQCKYIILLPIIKKIPTQPQNLKVAPLQQTALHYLFDLDLELFYHMLSSASETLSSLLLEEEETCCAVEHFKRKTDLLSPIETISFHIAD